MAGNHDLETLTASVASGDAVVEHYLYAARWEQSEHDSRVTGLERRRMVERG